MFDQFSIRHMVSGEVFFKAKKLVAQDKISHILAGGTLKNAFVMGRVTDLSEKTKYDPYVRVNAEAGRLLDASCDCKKMQGRDEPCVHCTALLLYFAKHPKILEEGRAAADSAAAHRNDGAATGSTESSSGRKQKPGKGPQEGTFAKEEDAGSSFFASSSLASSDFDKRSGALSNFSDASSAGFFEGLLDDSGDDFSGSSSSGAFDESTDGSLERSFDGTSDRSFGSSFGSSSVFSGDTEKSDEADETPEYERAPYDDYEEDILGEGLSSQSKKNAGDPFKERYRGDSGDIIDADWRPYAPSRETAAPSEETTSWDASGSRDAAMDTDGDTEDALSSFEGPGAESGSGAAGSGAEEWISLKPESVPTAASVKKDRIPARPSSSDAAGLLRTYESRAIEAAGLQRSPEIELIPYARLTKAGLCLAFRIGKERMYLVRNIQDLANAIENGSTVKYGKFIAFKHDLSSFSESSRPVAAFVLRTMRTRRARQKAQAENTCYYSSTYRGSSRDAKLLTLDMAELDDFMEMESFEGRPPQPEDKRAGDASVSSASTGSFALADAPAAFSADSTAEEAAKKSPDAAGDAGMSLPASLPASLPYTAAAGASVTGFLSFSAPGFYFDFSGHSPTLDDYNLVHVAFDMPRFGIFLKREGSGLTFSFDQLGMAYLSSEKYLYFFDKRYVHRVEINKVADILPFLNYVQSGGSTYFGPRDLPSFTDNLLPALKRHFDIDYGDFRPALYASPGVSFRIDVDNPQRDMITCYLTAVYEDRAADGTITTRAYGVFAENSGIGDERPRNRRQEAITGSAVSSYFTAFDRSAGICVYQGDEDEITTFIAEVIPKLEKIAPVYLSNTLKHAHVIQPRVNVGVSFTSDLLRVDLVSDALTLPQIAEILSRYDPKKKYYRLTDGDIVRFSGHAADQLAAFQDGLGLKKKDIEEGNLTVPAYRALYLDDIKDDRDFFRFSTDDGFKKLVMEMKEEPGKGDSTYAIPKSLENVLRGYQKEGFYWLARLKSHGFGGILADQMGLGKTLQVLSLLLAIKEKEGSVHALIVCPASLVYNWGAETQKFTPTLTCALLSGTRAYRKSVLKDMESMDTNILITSYDTLKRDISFYEGIHFDCQVLDEAQYIKNPDTQQAKAAKSVDAEFRIAMTGTPIENRLSELWSIFDYCMPGFLFTYPKFREKFEVPGMNELMSPAGETDKGTKKGSSSFVKRTGTPNGGSKGPLSAAGRSSKQYTSEDGVSSKDARERHVHSEALSSLRKMVSPFILRRLKKNVLKDLPDKDEETMYAPLLGEQKDLYQAHMQRLKVLLEDTSDEEFRHGGRILILSELTRLRQLCCDPSLVYRDYRGNSGKSDLCIDLIKSATDEGHQVLLFSQFTSMLDSLTKRLDKEKISYLCLYGSTPTKDRYDLVERFQKKEAQVFCISLKAGGTGLNLTAADIVIHYDPWWNSAAEEQATDRAHRIGQKNTVTVYKLIMKDTIEERIHALQENKNMLADEILRGEEIKDTSLTRERLMKILE